MRKGRWLRRFALSGILMLQIGHLGLAKAADPGAVSTLENPYSKADGEWHAFLARHGYEVDRSGTLRQRQSLWRTKTRGALLADEVKAPSNKPKSPDPGRLKYYRDRREVEILNDADIQGQIGSRSELEEFLRGDKASYRGFDARERPQTRSRLKSAPK